MNRKEEEEEENRNRNPMYLLFLSGDLFLQGLGHETHVSFCLFQKRFLNINKYNIDKNLETPLNFILQALGLLGV